MSGETDALKRELEEARRDVEMHHAAYRKCLDSMKAQGKALEAMGDCSRILLAEQDVKTYARSFCRILVKKMGLKMAWVGLRNPAPGFGKVLEKTAFAGDERGYLARLEMPLWKKTLAETVIGEVLSKGFPRSVEDLSKPGVPVFRPEEALARGYRSKLVLPLLETGVSFGVLCLYSSLPGVFGPQETGSFMEMAQLLSHGIRFLERESQNRENRSELSIKSKALENYQRFYEGIAETQRDLVCRFLPDTTLTFVNAAFCEAFQVEKDDVLGKRFSSLLTEEENDALNRRLSGLSAEKPVTSFEQARTLRNGETRIFHWIDQGIFDSDGNLAEAQSVGKDITERIRAEAKLRETASLFEGLFENSPAPMLLLDQESGKILLANQAAAQFYGYPRETLEKLDAYGLSLKPPELLEKTLFNLAAGPRILETAHRLADGTFREMEIAAGPIYWQGKRVIHAIAMDVTERNQALLQLDRKIELQRLAGEIVSLLSFCESWEDFRSKARKALAMVGPFSGVDRACIVLFETADRREVLEWCAPGIPPLAPFLKGRIPANFPWWLERLGNEGFLRLASVKNLPPTAETEHAFLENAGIGSLLSIAIRAEGRLSGFVGFADPPEDSLDPSTDYPLLSAIAQIIGKTLESLSAQREREIQRKRLEALFENSLEGILEYAGEGRIVRANRAFLEMFGFSGGEVEGKDLCEILEAPNALREVSIAEQIRRTLEGEAFQVEIVRSRRGGAPLFLSAMNVPRQGADGIDGAYFIYRDLTPLKRREADLRKNLQQLAHAFRQTVEVLSAVAEARDPYTAGHQKGVARLSRAIGEKLGFSEDFNEGLFLAGLVHDIGKIAIPAGILSKPARLSEIESRLVKTHPQEAYRILSQVNFPWKIAEAALQHHERLDGSGYPAGLKGEEILLEARILAVADVVEAASSHRPYRPALCLEEALGIVTRGKETLFDPDVVDACVAVFKEGFRLEE
ncbi:MAG: PAS domain S-box protein [Veillonellaceae bacterium]|nr:PAS domain S-box protein [Veillonellaceae bacterium]